MCVSGNIDLSLIKITPLAMSYECSVYLGIFDLVSNLSIQAMVVPTISI